MAINRRPSFDPKSFLAVVGEGRGRGNAATLEHPRPYLFRIAANLAVDLARKTKVRLRYAGDGFALACHAEAPPSPEAAAGGAMELRRQQASLRELPPLCRDAFLLNRVEDLTHGEIAERLGVSERTIDRHMVKAWEHLRGHFGRGCTTGTGFARRPDLAQPSGPWGHGACAAVLRWFS